MTPLRCLLASPTPGRDDESGDVQYTRDLLASPPDGVTYVTYAEALDSGELVDGPTFRAGAPTPSTPGAVAAAAARTALHAARRTDVLLPDPVRWWSVAGRFDVVHTHCFPVRLLGAAPPVVATDSAGTFWYWTAARGRDAARVRRQLRRERWVGRRLGYVHPTATPDAAVRALYFVAGGRDLAASLGVDRSAIGTAPSGVPPARRTSAQRLDPPTLLFVARNFEIKGGPAALDVLRAVRTRAPDCRLLIAGPPSPLEEVDGVTWLGSRSREELYRDVYPEVDLFLYPTRFDCAPLVVAEALAHGVPVVAPRVFGLPDMVVDGTSGVLVEPGSTPALVDAVLGLLADPARLRALGRGAVADFAERLSTATRNRLLRDAYDDARRMGGPARPAPQPGP